MNVHKNIRLVIADVDGTLVTHEGGNRHRLLYELPRLVYT